MNSNAEFILHASRAFFSGAWADLIESKGGRLRGEIYDQMPEKVDPAAKREAKELLAAMLKENSASDAQALLDRCPDEGDRSHTLETLGHYAAMQAMGTGVGLGDAFGDHECLRVPYAEFGLYHLTRSYSARGFK